MEKILGLQTSPIDNVATIFSNDAEQGSTAMIMDKAGQVHKVQLNHAIPYGHKVALCHISSGCPIIKYGEVIGSAMSDIDAGDYVHVHNLESRRGRGDLEPKGGAE